MSELSIHHWCFYENQHAGSVKSNSMFSVLSYIFLFYISQIDKHHIIKQIKAHPIEARAVKHVLNHGNNIVPSNKPARPTTYNSHNPRSLRDKLRIHSHMPQLPIYTRRWMVLQLDLFMDESNRGFKGNYLWNSKKLSLSVSSHPYHQAQIISSSRDPIQTS